MTVELDFVVPPADLAAYVTLFYHFRADVPRFTDVERAGHAQLRFRLAGDNSTYRFADGVEQRVGPMHIVGRRPAPPAAGSTGRSRSSGWG